MDDPVELKMAVFATNEKRTFIDISPMKGNVFTLIEEAEKYIKKNMHWRVVINGFDRVDVPEIPIDALREIIVNSFAHANYVGWSKNEIDIFPNRVSIYNPGAFPDDLNPEDFAKRTIASRLRNELICDVLYKCRYVETWGTGLAKTYSLCDEAGIRCGYEKEGDGFWFIFHRNVTNDVTNVTNDVTNSLSELEKIVLQSIIEEPTISKYRIAGNVGRSHRTIQRVLDSLKGKGLIRRIGGTKGGHWEVIG